MTGVASACWCRQLCLDARGLGCRGWTFYAEKESTGAAKTERNHVTCYLFTSPLRHYVLKGRDWQHHHVSGDDWEVAGDGKTDGELSFGGLQASQAPPLATGNPSSLTAGPDTALQDYAAWTSGDVGVILESFSPTTVQHNAAFTLKVKGVGLPDTVGRSGRQRVKLVPLGSACSAAMRSHHITGVRCSDPLTSVCSPGPSMASEAENAWANLVITASVEQKMKVCYCLGPCHATGQFTEVPGVLTVKPSQWRFTMYAGEERVPAASIASNHNRPLELVVERAALSTITEPRYWQIKVVEISGRASTDAVTLGQRACDKAPAAAFVGLQTGLGGPWAAGIGSLRNQDRAHFQLSLNVGAARVAGLYGACLCEAQWTGSAKQEVGDCTSFSAIPGTQPEATGAATYASCNAGDPACSFPYIRVLPAAADLAIAAGVVFDQQSVSGRAGQGFPIELRGSELDRATWSSARVAFLREEAACTAVNVAKGAAARVDDAEWITTSTWLSGGGNLDRLSFEISFSNNVAYGAYSVCLLTGTSAARKGTLFVTRRPTVDRLYLLDPAKDQSIEVAGTALSAAKDRIMVIDCGADCGNAPPAVQVKKPAPCEGATGSLARAKVWHGFSPLVDTSVTKFTHSTKARTYKKVPGRFCFGATIEAATHPYVTLQAASCWSRCAKASQTRKDSGCDGYWDEGTKSVASSSMQPNQLAVCAAPAECRALCDALGDACFAVTTHATLSRCFLKAPGVQGQQGCVEQFQLGHLGVDSRWNLHVSTGSADPYGTSAPSAAPAAGVSSSTLLRFAPVRFDRGGRFKVCFCDYELWRAQPHAFQQQASCEAVEYYRVEVGLVHVTGVSCLLKEQRYRRSHCVAMYHKGLSCGGGFPVEEATAAAAVTASIPWYTKPEELSFKRANQGHDSENTGRLSDAHPSDISV